MIIKKESVCKKTGKKKISYSSDKPGFKIVIKGGIPEEIKMTPEEKSNRDHGANTVGHGAEGSRRMQKGQTKLNAIGAKEYKEKKELELNVNMNESKIDPFKRASQKVDSLRQKLRKAKLEQMELMLVKRESEVVKKEKEYGKYERIINNERKSLKDKHSYYTTDTDSGAKTASLRKNIVDKIDDIVGKTNECDENPVQKEEVKESKTIYEKLKQAEDINKMVYGDGKRSYNKGNVNDIVSKLTTKLQEDELLIKEADPEEEEEEPKKETKPENTDTADSESSSSDPFGDEPAPSEEPEDSSDAPEGDDAGLDSLDGEGSDTEGGDAGSEGEGGDIEGGDAGGELGDLGGEGEEDAEIDPEAEEDEDAESEMVEPNEIQQIVDREEFNVNTNNAYDYYDFIIDKLLSKTAIEAMNAEYSAIPEDRRKITPASQMHNGSIKRLNLTDKAEKDRLEQNISGEGGGEEEGGL